MSQYRLTTLSPVHISSGHEFELNFNALKKDGYIYLYDEFSIVEFFIAHSILVPSSLEKLKKEIEKYSDKIIASNLHIRKIESTFHKFTKPILENISTSYRPIVSGSSIKGSLRTAILDCMTNLDDCNYMKTNFKDKNFDKKRFNQRFDNDLANLFKYLKVTDSSSVLETKVYKTINVKKNKFYQQSRELRTEEISNYVEAIKPNQSFIIEIKDTHMDNIFKNIGKICNQFYIPFFGEDENMYATKDGYLKNKIKKLSSDIFLINVGRFSGAESKSINYIREIKGVKDDDKSTTTARTFALEDASKDKIYYENELLPFGWILCEKLDNLKIETILFNQEERFEAIDTIHNLQKHKIEEQKEKEGLRKKREQEEAEAKAKKEAEEKARLAAMTPLQRLVDSYSDVAVLINDMKAGKIEDFDSIKVELAQEVKKILQQSPKTWDKAKKKALDRKVYIDSILKG
jgi:CRISPR-associated protein Csm5